jgi:hypothetical protein
MRQRAAPTGTGTNHIFVVPSHPLPGVSNLKQSSTCFSGRLLTRRIKTTLAHAARAWIACCWHTPPREEGRHMNERQKAAWSGVLLTVIRVGSCWDYG